MLLSRNGLCEMDERTVFENANVITMDEATPCSNGVVVASGRIVSLDPDSASDCLNRIDCQGKTMIPGLVDTHIHLHAYAKKCVGNDLSLIDGLTIEKVRAYISDLCSKADSGEWITIFGYDPYRIAGQELLTRWDIDEVSRNNPVRMYHRSGQGQLCNSHALELMGISIESEDPDGGMIDRVIPSGEPSGMLYGMDGYISAFVPTAKRPEMQEAATRAGEMLAKAGITCVHDATLRNTFERLETLERWHEQGALPQRLRCMIGIDEFLANRDSLSRRFEDHGSFYGVKIILNEIRGRLNIERGQLKDYLVALEEASVPGMIHCVDELQLEVALDAIEAARNAFPGRNVPHRIEHASLCSDQMIERMAALGAYASSQPGFLYYSGERYLDTIDEGGIQELYRFRSLRDAGVNVSFSSDAPISPVKPFKGIYSAVTRRSEKGRVVLGSEQLSVMDGLRMYTINGARAMGMDGEIGSLSCGKRADMVLLSSNPLSCDLSTLESIEAEMTVIGGRTIWQASA